MLLAGFYIAAWPRGKDRSPKEPLVGWCCAVRDLSKLRGPELIRPGPYTSALCPPRDRCGALDVAGNLPLRYETIQVHIVREALPVLRIPLTHVFEVHVFYNVDTREAEDQVVTEVVLPKPGLP